MCTAGERHAAAAAACLLGHLYNFFSEMFVMKSWGIDEHITL